MIKFLEKFKELPDDVRGYLHKRGLEDWFIEEKMIGFVSFGSKYFPATREEKYEFEKKGIIDKNNNVKFQNRILLPFWRDGEVIYITSRAIDSRITPKYYNQKGEKPYLGEITGADLIVTEGIFDQYLAEQQGFSCIAIAGQSKLEIDLPDYVDRIFLAFDNDEAGKKFTIDYAEYFVNKKLDVYVYELGKYKDLADYLKDNDLTSLEVVPIIDWLLKALNNDKRSKKIREAIYVYLKVNPIDKKRVFNEMKDMLYTTSKDLQADFEAYLKEVKPTKSTFYDDGIVYTVPEDYYLKESGLIHKKKGQITSFPVFVKNIGVDNITGKMYLQLKFQTPDKRVSEKLYPASIISNTREIIKLSDDGIDVRTGNALALSEFLIQFKNENSNKYDPLDVSSQLGWHKNSFILPNEIIKEDGEVKNIYFYGQNVSSDAYTEKGNLKTWVEFIRTFALELKDPDFLIFLLYAGFASMLLEKAGGKSLIIHLYGDTSQGKSTALMLPASIIGKPEVGGVILRWKNTKNFIIRYVEQLKNIPFFLDELSTERTDVSDIVYQLEGGISKGKASRKDAFAVEKQRTWSTITFSTGEPPLVDEDALSGSLIRTWQFWGNPFKEDNREFVLKFEEILSENYGFAVKPFLKAVIQMDGAWKSFDYFLDELPKENVGVRLAKQMQIVYIAGKIAEDVFNFGYDPKAIVRKVFYELLEGKKQEARIAERFIDYLRDYIIENLVNFPKISEDGELIGSKMYGNEITKPVYGFIFGRDVGILKNQFNEIARKFSNGMKTGGIILKELDKLGYVQTYYEPSTGKKRFRTKKVVLNKPHYLVYFPDLLPADENDDLGFLKISDDDIPFN